MAFTRASAVALLLTILLPLGPSSAETWRVSALDWPPYASPRLPEDGLAVTALRKALSKIGVTLEVDYMPFPRAQALARSGLYIGYFPAWPEEVLEGFTGSGPVMMSQVGLVERRGTLLDWHHTHDLFEKYRIGYVRSYGYPAPVQIEIDHHSTKATGVDDEADLVRMLAANRIDAALTDPNVTLHVAGDMKVSGLAASPQVLFRKPLLLAFSAVPENAARRRLLNSVLPIVSQNELVCCAFIPLKQHH